MQKLHLLGADVVVVLQILILLAFMCKSIMTKVTQFHGISHAIVKQFSSSGFSDSLRMSAFLCNHCNGIL